MNLRKNADDAGIARTGGHQGGSVDAHRWPDDHGVQTHRSLVLRDLTGSGFVRGLKDLHSKCVERDGGANT